MVHFIPLYNDVPDGKHQSLGESCRTQSCRLFYSFLFIAVKMTQILRCAIVLLLAHGTMVNFRVLTRAMSTVAKSFETHGVVPDVLPKAPAALATVKFPSGVEATEGNILTPTQVKDKPTVIWEASSSEFYTLAMTDPDAPSRAEPKFREWHHWLVGNIPGNNVQAGEVLSDYIGSGPPPKTSHHRYVFVVYKQPGKLTFTEPRLTNTSGDNRAMFSIAKFAEKYNLGDPIAGNFYQAEYDDYVPILYKQLGN